MNPQQQPQVPDSVAMANAIQNLPPAPAPTNVMGGQPPIAPPIAPPAAPPAPDEGDGFFGTPPAPVQPYIPQYPQPPAMPPAPAAPVAPVPAPAAPGQPAPAPQAPPVPDPNAIPIGLPAAPAPAPAPADATPAWAQEVIDAAAQIKAAQSGQPAPGTVPAAPAPGAPAATEWKPESWADVERHIEERAQQLFQQGLTTLQANQQAQAEAESQALAEADRAIDQSLEQLRQTGYLPPITDPSNREDAGVAAQRELIGYTISQGTDDLTKTAPVLYALHQSGYYFDLQQNKLVRRGSQTAAAQAPIAGATPSVSAPQAGQITYRDLATMDLHSMADRAAQAFPTDNNNMNL